MSEFPGAGPDAPNDDDLLFGNKDNIDLGVSNMINPGFRRASLGKAASISSSQPATGSGSSNTPTSSIRPKVAMASPSQQDVDVKARAKIFEDLGAAGNNSGNARVANVLAKRRSSVVGNRNSMSGDLTAVAAAAFQSTEPDSPSNLASTSTGSGTAGTVKPVETLDSFDNEDTLLPDRPITSATPAASRITPSAAGSVPQPGAAGAAASYLLSPSGIEMKPLYSMRRGNPGAAGTAPTDVPHALQKTASAPVMPPHTTSSGTVSAYRAGGPPSSNNSVSSGNTANSTSSAPKFNSSYAGKFAPLSSLSASSADPVNNAYRGLPTTASASGVGARPSGIPGQGGLRKISSQRENNVAPRPSETLGRFLPSHAASHANAPNHPTASHPTAANTAGASAAPPVVVGGRKQIAPLNRNPSQPAASSAPPSSSGSVATRLFEDFEASSLAPPLDSPSSPSKQFQVLGGGPVTSTTVTQDTRANTQNMPGRYTSMLHIAAANGYSLSAVQKIVRDNPELVFVQDEEGRLPLHYAAAFQRERTMHQIGEQVVFERTQSRSSDEALGSSSSGGSGTYGRNDLPTPAGTGAGAGQGVPRGERDRVIVTNVVNNVTNNNTHIVNTVLADDGTILKVEEMGSCAPPPGAETNITGMADLPDPIATAITQSTVSVTSVTRTVSGPKPAATPAKGSGLTIDPVQYSPEPLAPCADEESDSVLIFLLHQFTEGSKIMDASGKKSIDYYITHCCLTSLPTLIQLWQSLIANPGYTHLKEEYLLGFAITNQASYEVIEALLLKYPIAVKEEDLFGKLPLHYAAASIAAFTAASLFPSHSMTCSVPVHGRAITIRDSPGKERQLAATMPIATSAANMPTTSAPPTKGRTATRTTSVSHVNTAVKVIDLLISKYPQAVTRGDREGRLPIHYASASAAFGAFLGFETHSLPSGSTGPNGMPVNSSVTGMINPFLACAVSLLTASPVSIQSRDKDGKLPLHYCVTLPRQDRNPTNLLALLQVIDLFIEKYPASLIAADNRGFLPLHQALRTKSPQEVIRRLIPEYNETTTSSSSAPGNAQQEVLSLLHYALVHKSDDEVIHLLLDYQPTLAAIKQRDSHQFPLHTALFLHWPSLPTIKRLMACYPAAVKEKDLRLCLPLHYAFLNIIKTLQASPHGNLVTPVEDEAIATDVEVIRMLLQRYPEGLKEEDGDGKTPLAHYLNYLSQAMLASHPNVANADDASTLLSQANGEPVEGDKDNAASAPTVKNSKNLKVLHDLLLSVVPGAKGGDGDPLSSSSSDKINPAMLAGGAQSSALFCGKYRIITAASLPVSAVAIAPPSGGGAGNQQQVMVISPQSILHHSASTLIVAATDESSTNSTPPQVVLKFMRNFIHYDKEVTIRKKFHLTNTMHIAELLDAYDAKMFRRFELDALKFAVPLTQDVPALVATASTAAGSVQSLTLTLSQFDYCLVLPRAVCSLDQVLKQADKLRSASTAGVNLSSTDSAEGVLDIDIAANADDSVKKTTSRGKDSSATLLRRALSLVSPSTSSPYDEDRELIRQWIRDVLLSLQYLHNKGVIHQEIKLSNILLMPNKHLVLTDLASALELKPGNFLGDLRTCKLSTGILPPEMFTILRANESLTYGSSECDPAEGTPEEGAIRYCQYFQHCLFSSYAATFNNHGGNAGSELDSVSGGNRRDSMAGGPGGAPLPGQEMNSAMKVWQKVAPVPVKLGDCYAVVCAHFSDPYTAKPWNPNKLLPYAPMDASKTIDIWSIGLVIYNLLTRSACPLFGAHAHIMGTDDFVTDCFQLSFSNPIEKLVEMKQYKVNLFLNRRLIGLKTIPGIATSTIPTQSVALALLEKLLNPNPKRRVVDLSQALKVLDEPLPPVPTLGSNGSTVDAIEKEKEKLMQTLSPPNRLMEEILRKKAIREEEIRKNNEKKGFAEGKGVPRLGGKAARPIPKPRIEEPAEPKESHDEQDHPLSAAPVATKAIPSQSKRPLNAVSAGRERQNSDTSGELEGDSESFTPKDRNHHPTINYDALVGTPTASPDVLMSDIYPDLTSSPPAVSNHGTAIKPSVSRQVSADIDDSTATKPRPTSMPSRSSSNSAIFPKSTSSIPVSTPAPSRGSNSSNMPVNTSNKPPITTSKTPAMAFYTPKLPPDSPLSDDSDDLASESVDNYEDTPFKDTPSRPHSPESSPVSPSSSSDDEERDRAREIDFATPLQTAVKPMRGERVEPLSPMPVPPAPAPTPAVKSSLHTRPNDPNKATYPATVISPLPVSSVPPSTATPSGKEREKERERVQEEYKQMLERVREKAERESDGEREKTRDHDNNVIAPIFETTMFPEEIGIEVLVDIADRIYGQGKHNLHLASTWEDLLVVSPPTASVLSPSLSRSSSLSSSDSEGEREGSESSAGNEREKRRGRERERENDNASASVFRSRSSSTEGFAIDEDDILADGERYHRRLVERSLNLEQIAAGALDRSEGEGEMEGEGVVLDDSASSIGFASTIVEASPLPVRESEEAVLDDSSTEGFEESVNTESASNIVTTRDTSILDKSMDSMRVLDGRSMSMTSRTSSLGFDDPTLNSLPLSTIPSRPVPGGRGERERELRERERQRLLPPSTPSRVVPNTPSSAAKGSAVRGREREVSGRDILQVLQRCKGKDVERKGQGESVLRERVAVSDVAALFEARLRISEGEGGSDGDKASVTATPSKSPCVQS